MANMYGTHEKEDDSLSESSHFLPSNIEAKQDAPNKANNLRKYSLFTAIVLSVSLILLVATHSAIYGPQSAFSEEPSTKKGNEHQSDILPKTFKFVEASQGCYLDACCAEGTLWDPVKVICTSRIQPLAEVMTIEHTSDNLRIAMDKWELHTAYTKLKGASSGQDYPWIGKSYRTAEPYKVGYFELGQDAIDIALDLYPNANVEWVIGDTTSNRIGLKDSWDVTFEGHGKMAVTVSIYEDNESTEALYTNTDSIFVKYIRREIRQMTQADRESWYMAMNELYTLSTDEGKEKYGEKYLSMDYFTQLHLNIAADRACDHLHDGFGFMMGHVQLTNMLEKVLQVIDPSMSMPYWEYIIDGENMKQHFDYNVYEWAHNDSFNEILNDNYFGMHDEFGDGTLQNSVFKDTMTVGIAGEDAYLKNSYGYLHAPWNLIDTPKVVRAFTDSCHVNWTDQYLRKKFPSCSDYDTVYGMKDTWLEFMLAIPYIAHGTLHRYLGTTHECADEIQSLIDDFRLGVNIADQLRLRMFVTMKHLYHDGLLITPDNCDPTTGFQIKSDGNVSTKECHYSCPTLEDDIAGIGENTLEEWMVSACGDDPSPDDPDSYFNLDVSGAHQLMNEAQQKTFLRKLCAGGVVYGDHGTASSSADISFWPVHPALERFFQFNLIENHKNGIDWDFEEEWPDTYVAWESRWFPECYGHHWTDKVLTLPHEDKTSTMPTNEEAFTMYNPVVGSSSMDYIYDSFDYSYCAGSGNMTDISCTGADCCSLGTTYDVMIGKCVLEF